MIYVLDTDHLSLLERGGGDCVTLQLRLEAVAPERIVTTIVTYEEQMRGWLERAAHANSPDRLLATYSRLRTHVETFRDIPLLPFDEPAIDQYERLRKARIRIGPMDLKIAAITLANDATLLTRNGVDFGKVPDLRAEDWSI